MNVRYFVFLEIADPAINALLQSLRRIFMEEEPSSNIHITVRGPYDSEPRADDIATLEARFRERLTSSRKALLVHGIRTFETPRTAEYHVAIRIQCEALRTVWWKPDFPIEKYGFNPHITLYSGKDKNVQLAIAKFLEREDLALICREFKFGTHVSRQRSLDFSRENAGEASFATLVDARRVRPGILDRAARLVLPYIRQSLEGALRQAWQQ